jgi:hypothetical protein
VLEHRPHEVNEYSLGVEVFGKPADFNPNEDNIVRVTARQLRAKLTEFYSQEGQADQWILEIPKGGYEPIFRHATAKVPPPPLGPLVTPKRRGMGFKVLAAAALASLALNIWLLLWTRRPAPNLLAPLLEESSPATLILDDPLLPSAVQWSGKPIEIESLIEPKGLTADSGDAYGAMLTGLINRIHSTDVVTVRIAARLSAFAENYGHHLQVRQCRELLVRELKQGNYILIGGVGSNPWVSLFQKPLNFEHFVLPGDRRGFINHKPRNGEAALYQTVSSSDARGPFYARVAFLKNPLGAGRIVLIGGTSSFSTEAAGDYAVSTRGMEDVTRLCGTANAVQADGLELLLETSAIAQAPTGARVVAFRCGH